MARIRGAAVTAALVLLAAAALAGCTGAGLGQTVPVLKQAREDLKLIDRLLEDKELGLLEDVESTEEMTDENIAAFQKILGEHMDVIGSRMEDILKRPVPADENLAALQQAELRQFEMASAMLYEFTQVLRYVQTLFDLEERMGALENTDATDASSIYQAFHDALVKASDYMKNSDPPTFLKSMNDSLVSSLLEMDGAVLYTLIAEELNDPMRRDAATYRMQILMRKFTRISEDANKDTADRMERLRDEARRLQTTNEALVKWVQAGLDARGAN